MYKQFDDKDTILACMGMFFNILIECEEHNNGLHIVKIVFQIIRNHVLFQKHNYTVYPVFSHVTKFAKCVAFLICASHFLI